MVFENKLSKFEREICSILSQISHHIHPQIIQTIQEKNHAEFRYFQDLYEDKINIDNYLFDGSACVFPGVRRYVSMKGNRMAYNEDYKAIIDDNTFPRHIWCYLVNGRTYNGPNWKKTQLNEFELAHIFAHKESELTIEKNFFENADDSLIPHSDFTCACNVILMPKGTVRPTDNSKTIKSVFYRRYIDLYGEMPLNGRSGFKVENVPEWYDSIIWNNPILPLDWENNVEYLLKYRKKRLTQLMKQSSVPFHQPT